jgi:hypothetical protein
MSFPVRSNDAGKAVAGAYSDPATDIVPIDISSTDHTVSGRALRCKPGTGVAGAVVMLTDAGGTRTTQIAVGETLPCGFTKIIKIGTTATGLEALI